MERKIEKGSVSVVYSESRLLRNIEAAVGTDVSLTEAPSSTRFDYGVNVSALAKANAKNPLALASEISQRVDLGGYIKSAEAVGPFVNFELDMAIYGDAVLSQVLNMQGEYGKEKEKNGRRVVIDMSSPNIAKRMSYGHLRSTIIGDALSNLYRSQGYEVIRDNHIGDWGTQFGKLIVAIKKWGNEQKLVKANDPIGELQELYVKFHSEEEVEKVAIRKVSKELALQNGYDSVPNLKETIEKISQEIMTRKHLQRKELDMDKVLEDALDRVIESPLEKEGRNWFLALENGNAEARRIWKLCVELSLKEFNQIYEILGVSFEQTLGESFYEDKLAPTTQIVENSGASKISEGALVVDMSDVNLGVSIVRKSDGASLYMTRDLACAIYRQEELRADKAVYVVGEDQKQYFQQLFEILKRLGYSIGENSEHIYFGMVSLPEGKMSTRKGRVVLLKDVINEGLNRADTVLNAKNPELAKDINLRNKVIRQVAVGALKWNDLKQDAKRSIIFDWDKALNFDGNSAPYVQYTAVRAKSILNSALNQNLKVETRMINNPEIFQETSEKALIRQLASYPEALKAALEDNDPSKIATYVYELAKRFNSFYTKVPVLKTEDRTLMSSRLKLVAASAQVITNALSIIGIEVPDKM